MKDATKVLFQEDWMSEKKYAVSYPDATFFFESKEDAIKDFQLLSNYFGAMFDWKKVDNALEEYGYYVEREDRHIGIYSLRGE